MVQSYSALVGTLLMIAVFLVSAGIPFVTYSDQTILSYGSMMYSLVAILALVALAQTGYVASNGATDPATNQTRGVTIGAIVFSVLTVLVAFFGLFRQSSFTSNTSLAVIIAVIIPAFINTILLISAARS